MFIKKAYTYPTFLCLFFSFLPYSMLASSPISNNNQDTPHTEQNDHSHDESLINEDIFMQYIDEVGEGLQQLNSNNLVLFLGPNGVGKSTTICSLLFGKLDQIKKDIFYKEQLVDTVYNIDIKDVKGKKHPKIGHKDTQSCTVFPVCYPLEKRGLGLCDFPGLFDPGGLEKRIAIAITSKQFLEKAKQIKAIVFVMSQSDLEAARCYTMNKVIEALTKMFANPLDHANSIFFALTKSDYSPLEFRSSISEFAHHVKKIKDRAGANNRKSLYNLLDTMLTKYQAHFLVVNPLEEESSKLIIARLEQSKGFPSKAIRFIGGKEINRAIRLFFTKCAKEGIEILDICNTYPKEIKEKTKEISDLDLKILETALRIQEHENEKNKKNTFETLLKGLKSDIVQAKADMISLREEKSAKEKYIRDYDHDTLVTVGCKIVSKASMNFKTPLFASQYRTIDIALSSDSGSYSKVLLDFNRKKGQIEHIRKSLHQYRATYWCYEVGGSGLEVTLLERSRIRYSREIRQAKKRIKELKESEIPDKKIAIAVLKGKTSLMEQLLVMANAPRKFDLAEELEARKKRQEKDRSSLQKELKEMKQELIDKEKALFRKGKLFKKIEETHELLRFTHVTIADFVREYRDSSSRVRKLIKKIESNRILLTAGYIRKYTNAFPKELFNIILRNLYFI